MKKELFEVWYNEFGRNLAIETCHYDYKEMEDDVWNKELRKKAKKIFSSVYNIFSNEIADKLSYLQDSVYKHLIEINNDYNSAMILKNKLEKSIKEITDKNTKLYDFYFAKKIDKEYFDEMKVYYGETLSELKYHLFCVNTLLHNIKVYKKAIEPLIVTD